MQSLKFEKKTRNQSRSKSLTCPSQPSAKYNPTLATSTSCTSLSNNSQQLAIANHQNVVVPTSVQGRIEVRTSGVESPDLAAHYKYNTSKPMKSTRVSAPQKQRNADTCVSLFIQNGRALYPFVYPSAAARPDIVPPHMRLNEACHRTKHVLREQPFSS